MCNSHCLCFKLPAIATARSAGIRLGERENHNDMLLLAGLGGDKKITGFLFTEENMIFVKKILLKEYLGEK